MDIQKEAFESNFKKTEIYRRECAIRGKDILEFSKTMGGYFNIVANDAWNMWQAAKAQAVPEGFGLFDGDTLTYSNGYSINCSFDDEFDCHVFDVSKDGCYIKTGMTQLEQAHCLVLSMIKLDAKDSMIEAQKPAND